MPASRVAVVTDSTAYLPRGVADKYDIGVVPLQVVMAGRVGAEGRDVLPEEVAAALAARARVSTSRPSPEEFALAYQRAADAGACAVVSVHLSGRLSGTVEAARLAAAAAPLEVRVVDSGSTAMGLGFPVIEAAEAAAGDADVEEVERAAIEAASRTSVMFYVDVLEPLRRGGRIGHAQAMFGTALMVKPLLHVVDGAIALREKVRTSSRAIARLEELAAEHAGTDAVDLAVHHLAAEERAQALADRLRARVPGVQSLHVSEVGAVVGAHAGPGLLGVVVHRR
jgi:DegV family protein with EDD domain